MHCVRQRTEIFRVEELQQARDRLSAAKSALAKGQGNEAERLACPSAARKTMPAAPDSKMT